MSEESFEYNNVNVPIAVVRFVLSPDFELREEVLTHLFSHEYVLSEMEPIGNQLFNNYFSDIASMSKCQKAMIDLSLYGLSCDGLISAACKNRDIKLFTDVLWKENNKFHVNKNEANLKISGTNILCDFSPLSELDTIETSLTQSIEKAIKLLQTIETKIVVLGWLTRNEPYDEDADFSGSGLVVLKLYDQALKDGDQVLRILHDGETLSESDVLQKLNISVERYKATHDRQLVFQNSNLQGHVLVFSGEGSQWLGMGQELIYANPTFYNFLVMCDNLLKSYQDWSVVDVLLSPPKVLAEWLRPDVGQRLICVIQLALASVIKEKGINIIATVGHSLGSIAAAQVAGAFSLEEAIKILVVYTEIQLEEAVSGNMLIVELSEEKALKHCKGSGIFLTGVLSERFCVLAGQKVALNEVRQELSLRRVFSAFIRTDVMVHSPCFGDELQHQISKTLSAIELKRTKVPYFCSNIADKVEGISLNGEYWADNLSKQVKFHKLMQNLLSLGYKSFIEVSPVVNLFDRIVENTQEYSGVNVYSTLDHINDSRSVLFLQDLSNKNRSITSNVLVSNEKKGYFWHLFTTLQDIDVPNVAQSNTFNKDSSVYSSKGLNNLSDYEKKLCLRKVLEVELKNILFLDPSFNIEGQTLFSDLGLTSAMAVQLCERLERITQKIISPVIFFSHPTMQQLCRVLFETIFRNAPTSDECTVKHALSDVEVEDHLFKKLVEFEN